MDAEVVFRDVDGRKIEIRIVDRDGRRRRRGGLLAPVSAGIDRPTSLLLVWMPAFDLVRASGAAPVIRIDGHDAATGRLPGARLHRRHLIKYAAPLIAVGVNPTHEGPVALATGGAFGLGNAPAVLSQVSAEAPGHSARVVLDPSLPDVTALIDGAASAGRWHVEVDGVRLTGGTWSVARHGDRAVLGLDVDERWQSGRLPWLMRLVTTVVPVFRRWPTTYRWRAEVQLGETPTMTARWERTETGTAQGYRRATRT